MSEQHVVGERVLAGQLTPLDPEQIVKWAQEHRARTGAWPGPRTPGIIPGTASEKWKNLDQALRSGSRGLPGGSSLMHLLGERCGVRNRNVPPPLTIEQVLAWADAYHERTGQWPAPTSGPIPESGGESWSTVAHALDTGSRGLPGRSSLPRLLGERRGYRYQGNRPALTAAQILAWADEHQQRTREWPTKYTPGALPNAPGESWTNLDASLRVGTRGLPGGSSLARLLAEHRGCRNRRALPPLTEDQVLAWADAYHKQHGRWPTEPAGRIARSGGETWSGVDQALRVGIRGLPGGSSLSQLLARRRGARHWNAELTLNRLLKWADAHRARTGRWPTAFCGPVTDAPGETWGALDALLRRGGRGLPGGSSLACLLAEARQADHRHHPRRLSVSQVLTWADEHRRRTGHWPREGSGPVSPGARVTWRTINGCLRRGQRGLPGGTSLVRFLAEHGRGGETAP